MDEGKPTVFGWFDSSFDFSSLLSPSSFCLPPSLPPLSSLLPSPLLFSLNLILSVSLLKPKCCCEGLEPLKSERSPPLAGQEQREGRAWRWPDGLHAFCWTLQREADGAPASALSFLLVSLLPTRKQNCWAGPQRQQRQPSQGPRCLVWAAVEWPPLPPLALMGPGTSSAHPC